VKKERQWYEIVLTGGGGVTIGVEWAYTAKQAVFQAGRKYGMTDLVANPKGIKLSPDLRRFLRKKKKNTAQLKLDL